MLIERFWNWLNEDPHKNAKRVLLSSPKAPLQIAERSLPNPERLWEMADGYEAKRSEIANEQYKAFASAGYPNFVQWVESQAEKSAAFGGGLLLLTFDNATGIVTAATPEPREILGPTSYALPLSHSAVQRVAGAVAEHFRRANFRVETARQERSCSRLGAQLTPAYDCLDIFWTEAETRAEPPGPLRSHVQAHGAH